MSDISALEARITAALDRIRTGVAAQAAAPRQDPEIAEALERERAANADLIETIRKLKDDHDTQITEVASHIQSQQAQMAALDVELQSLRAANVQLREMNTQLREAVTEGVDPALLEQAAAAEVMALNTQRSADVAEINVILNALRPLLEEPQDAAS
ncbi:hypothetical protein [Yoonia sediminilitoris]|uniref:Uncharacterized protein n=1 Tax=Yoonia sediminilitoris TaxID=1286148 RepID=A0A2T6KRH9_9RHOB|nr:hypothetical protein [Yoonia sediminilitoris]PUB19166.1 hypothetical protein C8N45_101759 [Yoonia sediminilitoris]RCW99334.1 hypothetical protein DFP92_101759 [Yoonia sediminilitoris]